MRVNPCPQAIAVAACFFCSSLLAQLPGEADRLPDPSRPTATASDGLLASYRADYRPLESGSVIQDANFYFLTLLQQIPEARAEMGGDLVKAGVPNKTDANAISSEFHAAVNEMTLSDETIEKVRMIFVEQVGRSPAFRKLVGEHLRPSGFYIRLSDRTDAEMMAEAWQQAARGINHIIRQYAFGQETRYPEIDGLSYNVHTVSYERMVLNAIRDSIAVAQRGSPELAFEPSLDFALSLISLNHRNEPGHWERLPLEENRLALEAIRHVDWKKYRYVAILLHGIGPDLPGVAISEGSRANCEIAARLYHEGLAPLIVSSGGYTHPKQTVFCEGIEMKRELMLGCDVPESAILVENRSRHTTTNVRNFARLLFASGVPENMPCISVSNITHIDFILSGDFKERCLTEPCSLNWTTVLQVLSVILYTRDPSAI